MALRSPDERCRGGELLLSSLPGFPFAASAAFKGGSSWPPGRLIAPQKRVLLGAGACLSLA